MHRPPAPATVATHLAVTGGTATAGAELTAFDAALHDAGLHDANLLAVSSVVPADATVDGAADRAAIEAAIEPGAFVPTVYAFEASDTPGEEVHAAVAGTRLDSGHGINVEHHGTDQPPDVVRAECDAMLEEMADVRGTSLAGERWYRSERIEVPEDGQWAGAVAAMAYLQSSERPE